jgi:hypothetical protein
MASKSRVDIKYANLFPWPFHLIAVIVLVVAVSLIMERPIAAVIMIMISGIILSASEGTEIDAGAREYREYKSFLFIKTGTNEKYSAIEKIFINTSKTKQQLYTAHTTKSSIFENIEYNAFLKFDDGTKIHLLQKRKKEDLVKQLNRIAMVLGAAIEDHTGVRY